MLCPGGVLFEYDAERAGMMIARTYFHPSVVPHLQQKMSRTV